MKKKDKKKSPTEIRGKNKKNTGVSNKEIVKNSEEDSLFPSNTEAGDEFQDVYENDIETEDFMSSKGANFFLRSLMDANFIEYASYVIKERAIPDINDGLKPVQRRILWSLYQMDDGKFHKVANVIGNTMKFHPHGDASIGEALIVLANKEYYIEKQGNFGNILTGDEASAARYIECRLSPLAREVLFNNDITEFTDSYDGRNKEPLVLPAKVPSLLMLGADGIAVGMATHILPHNFSELLQAQISILKGEKFQLYPDFLQGGMMDVSEYEDGNGKVIVRAKIDREGRKLIIREIPPTTTTEKLIASIEKAVNKNKIKIASINDYTGENVEIEIVPMRGYDPEKTLKSLYAYTDCSVSISVNMMVIKDNRPVQMSVSDVLHHNTEKLLEYLRRELEIELNKLQDKFHEKTLEQIFIENRIYKRIEKCKTMELVFKEIYSGLEKFKNIIPREVTDEDVKKLLTIQIRRISLFDIEKNKKELDEILKQIDEVRKKLKRLKAYAIKYLSELLNKYGKNYPRRTEIEKFDKIDKQTVALNNIRVGWDRANSYIGTHVRSDEYVTCNEFDKLVCVERSGNYKIVNIPDKIFIGKLFYFGRYDKNTEYAIVYRERKTGKCYAKRTVIKGFITDKQYQFCPKGCRLEIITTRINSLYECILETKRGPEKKITINLAEAPLRTPKARGALIHPRKIAKFSFVGLVQNENENQESHSENDDKGNPVQSYDIVDAQVAEKDENKTEEIDMKMKKDTENKSKEENVLVLEPVTEHDLKKIKKKSTQHSVRKASPKTKPTRPKKNDDDDLGIIQPEFGF